LGLSLQKGLIFGFLTSGLSPKLMEMSKYVSAGDDADELIRFEHWQTTNIIRHHNGLNVREQRLRANRFQIRRHVALDGSVTEAVVEGNINISTRNHANQLSLTIHD
jgi:hypothetical protein